MIEIRLRMAVINEVHKQVWWDSITAPYIYTHNHPYISRCKPELLSYLYCSYLCKDGYV